MITSDLPPHKIKCCYLCRSTANLTRDHVPPANLFPEPRPSNLITVLCCKTCNQGFSKFDEQFRFFVSSFANVSDIGKAIRREKVFAGSFVRSPAFKSQMASHVFSGSVQTALGAKPAPLIQVAREVYDPYLVRLTKGLLANYYPDLDYFNLRFEVDDLNQFVGQHPTFKDETSKMTADQRGDGVFRFWRRVNNEDRATGFWIYQFYEAALFTVIHSAV